MLLGGAGMLIGASLMAVKNYVTSEEKEPEVDMNMNPTGVTVGI